MCYADIFEQFQVHIFTMPSSIELEILIRGNVVAIVDVNVPGEHVKALTCACQLVQKIDFSEYNWKQSQLPENKRIEATEKQDETDIKGEIFVKAQWIGNGPKMPPIRSENLFKR